MIEAQLQQYPNLHQAFVQQGRPALGNWEPGVAFDNGDRLYINRLERALQPLLAAFALANIGEQLRHLFSQNTGNLSAATTELVTLSRFHQLGVLAAIGWPLGAAGSAP
ncbi:MAG: hypothetical protein ACAI43_09185, partial [Phycisphaerae bacterium]